MFLKKFILLYTWGIVCSVAEISEIKLTGCVCLNSGNYTQCSYLQCKQTKLLTSFSYNEL